MQNIGQKTWSFSPIPETEVTRHRAPPGHDGTYAYWEETHDFAVKIAPPINKVKKDNPDHYGSDCPMAGRMIQHGLTSRGRHPTPDYASRTYGLAAA